jgi:O-antigen ligase
VALLIVYTVLLIGAAWGLSRYDARMAKMFDFTALKEQSFMHYANQLVFAERLVYWQAGWELFSDHPVLGVGLGNAGFFFPEKLSAFSWALTEIRVLMYQSQNLPNVKSLWVRILAETGVVGLGLFLSWYFILWRSAQFLRTRKLDLARMVGLAGSFALIGLLVEGFSLDTFALPYFWVTFGIVTAACEFTRCAMVVQQDSSASSDHVT